MTEIDRQGIGTQTVWLRRESSQRMSASDAGASGTLPRGSLQFGEQTQCAVSITAEIVLGPGAGNALEGVLQFEFDESGAVDNGSLEVGGQAYPLVGQVNGRAIRVLVEVDNGQLVAFSGIAEQPLDLCAGAVYGQFGGPDIQNVGSWTGTAMGSGS